MAKKRGDVRTLITLQCPDCRERNYNTQKNRRNDTGRVEFNKYCPRCRGHKLHKEIR
ncbi:MAG: 50S ribosomal protein L33 [SAR202 cluster bacterium]|nr:50S ribosomal protein L33 [SAR202 cluster bacterium]